MPRRDAGPSCPAILPYMTGGPAMRRCDGGPSCPAVLPCLAGSLAMCLWWSVPPCRPAIHDGPSCHGLGYGGPSCPAILPYGGWRARRAWDFLRAMLASGVQLDQRDTKGHTALEKLVRLPVISSACQRAHVLCAIVLLNHAARPPRSLTVGSRNEACARCVAEYHDALVASVVRRTASSGQMPCCSIIADFLHLGVR
jgi:hypothetical protein